MEFDALGERGRWAVMETEEVLQSHVCSALRGEVIPGESYPLAFNFILMAVALLLS